MERWNSTTATTCKPFGATGALFFFPSFFLFPLFFPSPLKHAEIAEVTTRICATEGRHGKLAPSRRVVDQSEPGTGWRRRSAGVFYISSLFPAVQGVCATPSLSSITEVLPPGPSCRRFYITLELAAVLPPPSPISFYTPRHTTDRSAVS
jgi:hypothetical protein